LVEFHKIWYGGNAIQGDLDVIIFNPIASVEVEKRLKETSAKDVGASMMMMMIP
jgi:uncharacterized membrane protein